MQAIKSAFFVLAVALAVTCTIPALAQQSAHHPNEEPLVAQGQLVRVDATARIIAIRDAQGAQMLFRYTDDTQVTGADEGVAGLAAMSGTELTIHYTKQQQDNVATRIDVQKMKS